MERNEGEVVRRRIEMKEGRGRRERGSKKRRARR